jgi:hypothetical protein
MTDPPRVSQEIVIRDGEPVWRLCLGSQCVEERSGLLALQGLRRIAAEHGLEITRDGLQCCRAPETGPDPDGPYGEPGT